MDDYLYGTGSGSDDPGTPDFGFAWDSKSIDTDNHDLEMMVLSTQDNVWNGINMDDLDGSVSKKLVDDINGDGRTTDGYVRTDDGQSTVNFGTTTLMDFAVSWDYLETYTDLTRGQEWNIALASLANATDHNNLTGDIAGGADPSSLTTIGWAPLGVVPEPAVISLMAFSGIGLMLGRRLLPAKKS